MRFKNVSTFDEKDIIEVFTRYNEKHLTVRRIIIGICAVILFVLAYLMFRSGNMFIAALYILLGGASGVLAVLLPDISAKTAYKKQKKLISLHGDRVSEFSEDEFSLSDASSSGHYPYTVISEFGESENCCWIMAGSSIFAMKKDSFVPVLENGDETEEAVFDRVELYENFKDFIKGKIAK